MGSAKKSFMFSRLWKIFAPTIPEIAAIIVMLPTSSYACISFVISFGTLNAIFLFSLCFV